MHQGPFSISCPETQSAPNVDEKEVTVVEEIQTEADIHHGQHSQTTLDPMPSDSPGDPLNWPAWRKNTLLWIVALHAVQGPFSAAITVPAFMDFAKEFQVDINTAAFLTSMPPIFLGIFPIIWSPISARVGRRPIYLVSAIVSAACSLAGVFCHSYATLMITRIIQAIFLAPPISMGACTVREIFFAHERGQKMGVWALTITIGPPLGPVIVGFLVQKKGWRAAFIPLAVLQLALFVAHIFFGPETLYFKHDENVEETKLAPSKGRGRQNIHFPIHDRTPIRMIEFIRPFLMFARPVVALPAMAYAVVFAYTTILVTVFVPQVLGKKFGLSPGQIGLQMIAQLVGAVLGELVAGRGSDALMNWRTKKTGVRAPEHRLLLSYPGFLIAIAGLIVWGVQLQNATLGVWNITPTGLIDRQDIGAAIAVFGQQIVTTVCTTYAIESYISETASVAAFLTFSQHFWGFLGPFYLGHAITKLGEAKAAGLFSSIMGIGMFMVIACNIWGPKWRRH